MFPSGEWLIEFGIMTKRSIRLVTVKILVDVKHMATGLFAA